MRFKTALEMTTALDTPQAIFDFCYGEIVEQGEASMDGEQCLYFGTGSKGQPVSCGVGVTIPESVRISAMMWNKASAGTLSGGLLALTCEEARTVAIWMHKNARLLAGIQDAHDTSGIEALAEPGGDFVAEFKSKIQNVAENMSLKVPA